MTKCGIYKFTNKITNKSYIGQSIDIDKRYKEHIRAIKYFDKDTLFYRALRKYGIDNFSFSILEECSEDLLDSREKYWISYYDSFHNGYNMTEGGDFNPSKVPEIVEKRTHKLLYDKEINAKLHHKGEDNGNAKLTKEDVINIRTAFKEGKIISEVYPLYADKISYSGFQYCWLGHSWTDIMMDVYQERKPQTNGGSKHSRQEIYELRVDYMNGLTNPELQEKYNMSYEQVRRIIKVDRWKYPETIPDGYMDFISK